MPIRQSSRATTTVLPRVREPIRIRLMVFAVMAVLTACARPDASYPLLDGGSLDFAKLKGDPNGKFTATTSGDALNAKALADRKQLELAQAERSRAAVEDRAKAGAAALARRAQPQALGGRKAVGTPLE